MVDVSRVERARQAVEENRKRLNQIEFDQGIILAEHDKYRWLKIILGAAIVLAVLVALELIFKFI